jgi:hypothetical protein
MKEIDPQEWLDECKYLYLITHDNVHLQHQMELQRMLVEAHIEELKLEIEKLRMKRDEQIQ